MRFPIKEKDIQKAILDYLINNKYFFWRNNSGAAVSSYNGKKRFFRYGVKGSGDIIGVVKGRFFSIEVKAPGEQPTDEQWEWIARVRFNGGSAWYFDNFDKFVSWFLEEIAK